MYYNYALNCFLFIYIYRGGGILNLVLSLYMKMARFTSNIKQNFATSIFVKHKKIVFLISFNVCILQVLFIGNVISGFTTHKFTYIRKFFLLFIPNYK